MTGFVDETQKIIEELVGDVVKATEDYIQTVLQAPTEQELNALIAEHEIKAMHELERSSGIGSMD